MGLSYQIEGHGPPLLLLHGMGVTFTIWENLLPLLTPHYTLIMVELPGHGASMPLPEGCSYYQESAVQLEILRQELGIERWSMLGYSMGAWAAQIYIRCHPERVDKVVFLCPAVLTWLWSVSMKGLVQVDSFMPGLANWLLKSWRLHYLVRLFGFNGRDHPYAAVWTREISAQPVATIKALLRDLPGSGQAPFPLPVQPTLVLWGQHDIITTRPRPLRPVDHLVNGSHSAPMLAAAEISAAILGFLS